MGRAGTESPCDASTSNAHDCFVSIILVMIKFVFMPHADFLSFLALEVKDLYFVFSYYLFSVASAKSDGASVGANKYSSLLY